MGLRVRDHVIPVLVNLHWLPILTRIQSKVVLMVFLIHSKSCSWCSSSIQSRAHGVPHPFKVVLMVFLIHTNQCTTRNPSRQRLRSSTNTDYLIPRTRTKLSERSLSVVGLTTWNFLPETVHAVTYKTAFKRVLKTQFFNIAFSSS
jgi:hypothetical protein